MKLSSSLSLSSCPQAFLLLVSVLLACIHPDLCVSTSQPYILGGRHAMHIEPAPNLGGLQAQIYPHPRRNPEEEENRRRHRDAMQQQQAASSESLVPPSGARRLDTDDDLLIYEDIYPKRVPSVIHAKWTPELPYSPNTITAAGERQFITASVAEVPFSGSGQRPPFSNSGERWRTSASASSASGTKHRVRGRRRRERLARMRAQRRARKQAHQLPHHHQRARSHSSDDHLSFRSMLGVAPYCLNDDSQFSCMFTPMCWMAGGIPQSGCESFLYSCCVAPALARKVRFNKQQTSVSINTCQMCFFHLDRVPDTSDLDRNPLLKCT